MARNNWAACLVSAALALGVCTDVASATGSRSPDESQRPLARGAWAALLGRADYLGPSRARSADVLVALRQGLRPVPLLGWASARGLSATWFSGQPVAMLSASPERLGEAFGVTIDDFRLTGYGRFYAARRPALVPAALRGEVAAIGRISSLGRPRAYAFPIGGLGPGGFVDAYHARPLWSRGDFGQGETIVLFEVDGYSQPDLSTYASTFGLPAFRDPLPHIGALDLRPEGEAQMDLEVAHSIAPDATLVYVNLDAFDGGGSSPVSEFEQAFSTVSTRYPGAIWSISLGQCETLFGGTDLNMVNGTVAGAERNGSTVFAASGDSGGLECLAADQADPLVPAEGISFPADLPNVTSVGGTALDLTKWGGYVAEAAWTEPLLSQGSTGGQSVFFAQPSWQRGPGVVSSYSDRAVCSAPAGTYCREVPDVAADADPTTGAAVRFHSRWLGSGGTSLATPVWAAFCALIDEYLRGKGDTPVGFANPVLYQLARGQTAYPPFHQVTVGANDFYPAGPGYNMVTGLGTPDVWDIARDLAVRGHQG
jgi:kumamolisin